jgi:hypothetical protein
LTERQVRDSIHEAKRRLPRNTGYKNPDVVVDKETGEIRVKSPDGKVETDDSLGNITEPSNAEKEMRKRGGGERGGPDWDPPRLLTQVQRLELVSESAE